ncbi:MAG TPA: cytochrome c3 family protein [Planctomycetota bacterium]|jgi:hypothetical protein|nr:cytochrome c3 family protein [Planctomycetota bacterium]
MSARTLAILLGVLVLAGAVVVTQGAAMPLPGDHSGFEPDQPVFYSHQLHAGELQIPCLYCHYAAERGPRAGIPPEELCMNCHKFVSAPLADVRAEDAAAKAEKREPRKVVSPEIRKLYEALALDDKAQPVPGGVRKPVAWVRVHDLPDFVFFDHRSHVTAGVACETCHGPVQSMSRMRQQENLTMGWCVNCHRQMNATGLPDGRPAAASTDCTACHY